MTQTAMMAPLKSGQSFSMTVRNKEIKNIKKNKLHTT